MKKISIVAIILGALALLSVIIPMIIGIVLGISTPSSVGGIGGADGPTVIMITGSVGMEIIITVLAIGSFLLVIGIWGLRKFRQ